MRAEDATRYFFDQAARLAGPWTSTLEQLIKPGRQAIRDNFNSQASPDGVGWPPRKREGDGHPLLMDKGDLIQAATGGGGGSIARISGNTLSLGVNLDVVVYGRRHNLGDVPGTRDSLGRRMTMPKREFLGMTEERAREGDVIVGDQAERVLFGAPPEVRS